jgi:hypothetical protein
MVNLVGFTQGMREQRGTLNRRRRELANAFNEFKAANPTATFDEYQSFIDQYTGDGLGSNYLRGGAPSEEVLQTLASENEKRRKAQEEQALLESLRRRGETQGQLQGIADDVLLGMPGDDFEKGYQTFVERLGGEEAEEQFGRDRLQSYFGPNRLNTLANERVRQLLPDIRAYVESVDPNSIDAATLSEQFGVKNQAVLDPILETARTEAQRVNNDRIRQNRTQMINVMTSALQSGQDPVARVQAVYGDTNINLDSENIAPLLEEAQTTYEQDRQRVENQREQDRIDLTARVRDSLAGNEALQSAIRTGTKEDAKHSLALAQQTSSLRSGLKARACSPYTTAFLASSVSWLTPNMASMCARASSESEKSASRLSKTALPLRLKRIKHALRATLSLPSRVSLPVDTTGRRLFRLRSKRSCLVTGSTQKSPRAKSPLRLLTLLSSRQ